MPIRPQPFSFKCGDCGWKKIVAPKSDCLGPGDWFSKCPKCGSQEMKIRRAGWLMRKLIRLLE